MTKPQRADRGSDSEDAPRARYIIDVEVDRAALDADQAHVELVTAAVQCILARESVGPKGTSVNVLLTGDERLRDLNRQFAGDDYATDVLAFPTDAGEPFPEATNSATDPTADVVAAPGNSGRELGDIAISMPQVERQAREHRVSIERELALLAIHGTLHLLGYDHATPQEERDMFGRTDAALAELFGDDES